MFGAEVSLVSDIITRKSSCVACSTLTPPLAPWQLWQRRYQFAKNMLGLWASQQDEHSLNVAVFELKTISTECKHSGMPSVLWRDLADSLLAQADLALRDGDSQSAKTAQANPPHPPLKMPPLSFALHHAILASLDAARRCAIS